MINEDQKNHLFEFEELFELERDQVDNLAQRVIDDFPLLKPTFMFPVIKGGIATKKEVLELAQDPELLLPSDAVEFEQIKDIKSLIVFCIQKRGMRRFLLRAICLLSGISSKDAINEVKKMISQEE